MRAVLRTALLLALAAALLTGCRGTDRSPADLSAPGTAKVEREVTEVESTLRQIEEELAADSG